jgi:hypothetical protein
MNYADPVTLTLDPLQTRSLILAIRAQKRHWQQYTDHALGISWCIEAHDELEKLDQIMTEVLRQWPDLLDLAVKGYG